MNTCPTLLLIAAAFFPALSAAPAQVLWEAYNDHRGGATTAVNATSYDMLTTAEGLPLKNIATGQDLPALLVMESEGGATDNFGANGPVNPGSPAGLFFANFCEVGNDGIPGLRSSTEALLRLRFTGLDPARRYKFRGTTSRAGNYNDRWSIFKIVEADNSAAAHINGSTNLNLFTATTYAAAGLGPDEVALNSGDNKAGSLVGWDSINPGADGTFAIEARQYVGKAPFGNPAAGPYGYSFSAIYLAEVPATGNLNITGNPENKLVAAGTTATFSVTATSTAPITYRWQSTAAGGDVFTDIPGAPAAAASYITPVLTVADNNKKFRCRVTSGGNNANSGEATLRVDGVLPAISAITSSSNLSAVYITFSEPMALEPLGTRANYSINGGLTINAITALDPLTVKLSTTAQTPSNTYAVQLNNLKDLAGNSIVPNTSGTFRAFDIIAGAVGVDIWEGIGGNLASFQTDERYPDNPDRNFVAAGLDSTTVWPDGPTNTYGGRLRAWLTPVVSGNYHFFLNSDNGGELRLSTDASFANLVLLCTDTTAGNGFEEPGATATTAEPVALLAGQRYALEAIWEEDNGADYCLVAWRAEANQTPADQLTPLSGSLLSYYGPAPTGQEPLGKITSVRVQAGQIIIEWSGAGTLQTSPFLSGWTDIQAATSPYQTPVSGTKRYYRLRR